MHEMASMASKCIWKCTTHTDADSDTQTDSETQTVRARDGKSPFVTIIYCHLSPISTEFEFNNGFCRLNSLDSRSGVGLALRQMHFISIKNIFLKRKKDSLFKTSFVRKSEIKGKYEKRIAFKALNETLVQ